MSAYAKWIAENGLFHLTSDPNSPHHQLTLGKLLFMMRFYSETPHLRAAKISVMLHCNKGEQAMPSAVESAPQALNPDQLQTVLWEVMGRSQRLLAHNHWWQSLVADDPDPLRLISSYQRFACALAQNPAAVVNQQLQCWQEYWGLYEYFWQRITGLKPDALIEAAADDNRFKHADWTTQPAFDFLKQAYLLAAHCLQETLAHTEHLDATTRKKIGFFNKLFFDSFAPSNFALTNPAVLEKTFATGGMNLLHGLNNLLRDLERGEGKLAISMNQPQRFKLGNNIATTPGKVVYQTKLMQLIQYHPAGTTSFQRPLLIVPPWINKYYILDLQPRNSLVKWLVEQGHTVFIISWVNPDAALKEKTFEDYMIEGTLAALDAITQATGESQVNAIGYCLGGTLLAATSAWLQAQKEQHLASTTFLTTLIDFSEPGDLGVFIDEEQVHALETRMQHDGYLDGASMATTFNMLRANDLVWSFVIHNYLLGNEPFAFDLLHWNSDSTRMPAAMHSYYLRNMYLNNLLCKKNGLNLAGQALDVTAIQTPSYFLSTHDDHIAPWQSTYAGAKLMTGPVRFVLGGSGHIAGVINPPSANKYHYWINNDLAASPEQWLHHASRKSGSWWSDWQNWVHQYTGNEGAARQPGDGELSILENGPGSYVTVRVDAKTT